MNPSAPPLRILHLVSSERWTGVAEPVTSLAARLRDGGHRVWLACIAGRSFESQAGAAGVELVRELHMNRRLNPLHLLADVRFLRRFCAEHQLDIVHCHLPHDHWLASRALAPARRAGARPQLVRTLHGSGAPRGDVLHRWLYLKATDRIVCVSAHAARAAEAALRLPAGAVPHVAGGVDLERFRPGLDGGALRTEMGIPADAPVAGFVARLRAGRGLRWLMRAIPAALERLPKAHFIVVGRGELKLWFKEEMLKPIYRGRVRYAHYRTGDQLPAAYAAMDCSLFLGLGSEGTCRAILEAMACARPTVAAAIGAVPEIVENGATGLLVRDHDDADLTRALVEMLSDRRRCAEMGRAARARAERSFSESARADAFLALYHQVLDA